MPSPGFQHTRQISPLDRVRRENVADCLIVSSILFLAVTVPALCGALDYLFPPPSDAQATLSSYLTFPHSLAHFLPLLIPLTTYIVIARWTGEKHFRHS